MIIFVEGALASGKTTRAEFLAQKGRNAGKESVLYYEHNIDNPLDLTGRAFLSEDDYTEFKNNMIPLLYLHYGSEIKYGLEKFERASESFVGGWLINYNRLYYNDLNLTAYIRTLEKYQCCNGVLSPKLYCDLLYSRWEQFFSPKKITKKSDQIFEGALLQNPLLDLMGWYCMDIKQIVTFYRKLCLLFCNRDFRVELIHVNDYKNAIQQAAAERTHTCVPWIDAAIQWLEKSPYGKHNKLTGFDGLVWFCKDLQNKSQEICQLCNIPIHTIERKNICQTSC